jgi:ACS family glucarate transporter-like MFS transporter
LTAPAASAGSSARRLVVLMVALSGLSYFNRTIMAIAAPGIMREYAISETAMGTVYSALLLSYTVLMAPGGRLADRFGPRIVLGLGTLGTAVFTGLTALCSGLSSLVAVRFLFGACAAPLYPTCGRTTASYVPRPRQAGAQAWIIAGAAIGAALSPVLFARSIDAIGWRLSFAGAAVITALLATAWYRSLRDVRPTADPAEANGGGWKILLRHRNMLLLTISYGCLNYFEYIFFYWMYYYLREIRHLGSAESTTATTVLFLTMAVLTPAGGIVSDRLAARLGHGRARQMVSMVGMAASACLLWAGAQATAVVVVVAFLALALGMACAAEGPFWAATIQAGGSDAGTAGGILNTGGNIGGILAPVVTPALAARFGWAAGLYFAAAVVLAGVFCWLAVKQEK